MKIDMVTNARTDEYMDTIRALSHVLLSGSVITRSDEIMNDFNGIAEIVVYDKKMQTSTLGNDNNQSLPYEEFSSIIFKGRSTVKNGKFTSEFIVPQDIRYNFDKGKISLYAYSTDKDDRRQAAGVYQDVIIGGFDDDAKIDNEGPIITMYLNHESFKSGDETGSSPILFATIEDESGINIGNGIGHDLLLTIDGDPNKTIVLNSYFQGHIDNFRVGTVIFQLPTLEPGKHEITLKAWDSHNNSSIARLNFVVGTSKKLKISDFILHPVPVQAFGTVYFSFIIDEPNSAISIMADGINSAGAITGNQRIDTVSFGSVVEENSLSLAAIGIRNPGLYFIRFVVTTDTGKKGQIIQKIMVKP